MINVARQKYPLPFRPSLLMGAVAMAHAGVSCFILAAPSSGLPFSGIVPLETLPFFIGGLAVVLAVLIAPLSGAARNSEIRPEDEPIHSTKMFANAILSAMWQALILAYFLMVSSRLVPLDAGVIARSAAGLLFFAFICLLLAHLVPKAFAGIIFFWVIAIPTFCYIMLEVFLSSPTNKTMWDSADDVPVSAVRTLIGWLLNVSPGSGMMSTLASERSRSLSALGPLEELLKAARIPEEAAYAGNIPLYIMMTLSVVLMLVEWVRKQKVRHKI